MSMRIVVFLHLSDPGTFYCHGGRMGLIWVGKLRRLSLPNGLHNGRSFCEKFLTHVFRSSQLTRLSLQSIAICYKMHETSVGQSHLLITSLSPMVWKHKPSPMLEPNLAHMQPSTLSHAGRESQQKIISEITTQSSFCMQGSRHMVK